MFGFGTKTHAEEQCDLYEKVIKEVKKELKKTENLSEYKDEFARLFDQLEVNPECAEGALKNTFEDRESQVRSDEKKLFKRMKTAINDLNTQLTKAEEQLAYWEVVVQEEKKKAEEEGN